MLPSMLVDVALEALYLLLLLSSPILAAAFFTSVFVGLLTQYTKLSEPAIGYAARATAILGGLILVAPWLGDRVVTFATKTWQLFEAMAL